ncbi:hypothetical protein ACHAWX_007173, partial [Stephanocyclus meneghinianus]
FNYKCLFSISRAVLELNVSSCHSLLKFRNPEKMPRFLLKAKLKPEKEQQYIDEHNNIYPEVSSGLRSAGVINLHIWKDGLTLYMMIEMEEGNDLSALGEGSEYRNSCPRIQEWEVKMETEFHGGWTQIAEIHSSDNWRK